MEFRILGPLEVLQDGRQIDLGGAKQRALLAVLLLHANEVVSTDRLIDALWEDDAPETGRKALQVYVSQLRKALGRARIVTRSPGYRLEVEADELDLARFQRLLEDGHPGEALSLWRGPPLAEFAYERFARNEIERLEDLRLACLEDRIDADLAGDRQSALVGELEALVARASAARAAACAADARALPLGTAGGRARGLSGRPTRPRRGARDRAIGRAPRAAASSTRAGSAARPRLDSCRWG